MENQRPSMKRSERPEATLPAFENALAVGADVLEFDVHASADGMLMVMHDDTVDRTTEGTYAATAYRTHTVTRGQTLSHIAERYQVPLGKLRSANRLRGNSVKAGQTIPIKWQLKDASGNLISDLGSLAQNGLTSGSVACGSAPVDVVEELSAPGSTVFRFDGTQFIYNWQTTKSWAGGCRTLQVRLSDGTSHYAQFTFK